MEDNGKDRQAMERPLAKPLERPLEKPLIILDFGSQGPGSDHRPSRSFS